MEMLLIYLPALVLMLIAIVWCMAPWRAVARTRRRQSNVDNESADDRAGEEDSESAGELEPVKVSVVALLWNNEENPSDFIEEFLSQSYANKELILVADATAEASAVLSEQYATREGVYLTFVPEGSRNLSRRKLGEMIGIKAAKGDVVLLTATNCRPGGDDWLRDMMAPFSDENVEIAIGDARFDPEELPGFRGSRLLQRMLLERLEWLGAACQGRPYRGSCFNLAYRRRLFFENRGFSGSIGFEQGDDDVFISELATAENTRVVLTTDSIVTEEWGDDAERMYKAQHRAYEATRRSLPQQPRIKACTLKASLWMLVALTILALLWLSATLLPMIVPGLMPDSFAACCDGNMRTQTLMPGTWREAALTFGLYTVTLGLTLLVRSLTLRSTRV